MELYSYFPSLTIQALLSICLNSVDSSKGLAPAAWQVSYMDVKLSVKSKILDCVCSVRALAHNLFPYQLLGS